MTSIFGDLDIDEVPDDPFFIENGTYNWIVTKSSWKTVKPTDGSDEYTLANYVVAINDEASPFHGKSVPQSFRLLVGVNTKEMEPEQLIKAKETASRHKQWLRGLGVSETEMGELSADTTADIIVGREFTADYKLAPNKSGGNPYRNLNNVKPLEDSEEPVDTAKIGSFI